MKIPRQHADDGIGHAVQGNGLTQYIRSSTVAALPGRVAQEHGVRCGSEVLTRPEIPPQHWGDTKGAKETVADPGAYHPLGAGRRAEYETARLIDVEGLTD